MNNHKDYNYIAIHAHDESVAKELAKDHSMNYLGNIGQLEHHFLLSFPKLQKRDLNNLAIETDHRVKWMEHQIPQKRLFKRLPPPPMTMIKRTPYPASPQNISIIAESFGIKDPGFPNQWHLINQIQVGNDLNLTGVWKQNITGRNVTVTLLDDGLDYEHPDLKDNFFKEGSYDFNNHQKLPTPNLWDDFHGTRCAGEIAAVKNDICGIGIAYDAKVAGIRILSGELTVADEATAITYEYHKNHIFSCSWGPRDDGRTMEAPPKLAMESFKKGIISGRNGLGSIYVFAAGNGGASGDNCNFDGYTNSIYSVTVGAIDRFNQHPNYSEQCSANLVVTYSGPHGGDGIFTTDWSSGSHSGCTNKHGGTSAAAPLASGVFALVLSVRPDLTWRDLQHVIVESAVPVSVDDSDWQKVAKDRLFSHKFGYGVLDGYRIVEAAKKHVLVNPQIQMQTELQNVDMEIPDGSTDGIVQSFKVTEEQLKSKRFHRLEHVTVILNIAHDRRGDVNMELISPNGYVSKLIVGRAYDETHEGFDDWTVMSVKHWDENPIGEWKLKVFDPKPNGRKGKWKNARITFWGESEQEAKTVPQLKNNTNTNISVSTSISISVASITSAIPSVTGVLDYFDMNDGNLTTGIVQDGMNKDSNILVMLMGVIIIGIIIGGVFAVGIVYSRRHKDLGNDAEINGKEEYELVTREEEEEE